MAMRDQPDGKVGLDAKHKEFLERLTGMAREGRRPLAEFLQLAGNASEDDLRGVRSFLFDLFCQIYDIDGASEEGSGVRFKLMQELSRGKSVEEITNLFIGNLYLAEHGARARAASVAEPVGPRGLAERAQLIIERDHAHRISLHSIAQELSVSKEHLSRIFKKRHGVTVTERIHQVRIDSAQRLMSSGTRSLKQVCYESGYQSYNDFYRNFRKVTGVSPKDFVVDDVRRRVAD